MRTTQSQEKPTLPDSLHLLAAAVTVVIISLSPFPYSGSIRAETASEYRTHTGKTITVSETHPVGHSLSTIEIRTNGFEHDFHEVYEDRDPVSDVLVADLDDNGFDEVYIITTSAGSGSYGTVLGFASNSDKSLSMIHFPDADLEDDTFAGYMGHDTFEIRDRKLVRSFPIYNGGDSNENPTGGKKILVYGLHPGEAGWQLKLERQEKRT